MGKENKRKLDPSELKKEFHSIIFCQKYINLVLDFIHFSKIIFFMHCIYVLQIRRERKHRVPAEPTKGVVIRFVHSRDWNRPSRKFKLTDSIQVMPHSSLSLSPRWDAGGLSREYVLRIPSVSLKATNSGAVIALVADTA